MKFKIYKSIRQTYGAENKYCIRCQFTGINEKDAMATLTYSTFLDKILQIHGMEATLNNSELIKDMIPMRYWPKYTIQNMSFPVRFDTIEEAKQFIEKVEAVALFNKLRKEGVS